MTDKPDTGRRARLLTADESWTDVAFTEVLNDNGERECVQAIFNSVGFGRLPVMICVSQTHARVALGVRVMSDDTPTATVMSEAAALFDAEGAARFGEAFAFTAALALQAESEDEIAAKIAEEAAEEVAAEAAAEVAAEAAAEVGRGAGREARPCDEATGAAIDGIDEEIAGAERDAKAAETRREAMRRRFAPEPGEEAAECRRDVDSSCEAPDDVL